MKPIDITQICLKFNIRELSDLVQAQAVGCY